jgi:hypothetical protein
MFWNDPEHCLESIILIEDEDDILSIPRQIQVYCICLCLGLSQANKPVSLYSLHTVQTNCWKPVQLYCVHTVQLNFSPTWKQSPPKLDLSPGGPGRGQLTASPATRWERPLSRVCLPFPSTRFLGLGWPREGTPPRASVAAAKAPATRQPFLTHLQDQLYSTNLCLPLLDSLLTSVRKFALDL